MGAPARPIEQANEAVMTNDEATRRPDEPARGRSRLGVIGGTHGPAAARVAADDARRPVAGRAAAPAPLAWWPTALAAVLAAAAALVLIVAVDRASPAARPVVLASLQDSARWLATAMIGAGSTIAALMLATISLLDRLETRRMQPAVLLHLRLTVFGAVATIAGAVGALLLTAFPAGDRSVATAGLLGDAVFYGLQGVIVLMVGAFAVVLTSLAATVADVLRSLPEAVVAEILDEPVAETETET
jgi:hypothetical protein